MIYRSCSKLLSFAMIYIIQRSLDGDVPGKGHGEGPSVEKIPKILGEGFLALLSYPINMAKTW